MSVMDAVMTTAVVFSEVRDEANADSVVAYLDAEQAVASLNIVSSRPDPDALDAFIELLYLADQEYMEVPEYAQPEPAPLMDWEAVASALEESQRILVLVQEMLSSTLAGMGVEDYDSTRVYADEAGWLRVVGEHARRDEIESVLNSFENKQLREYYMSATAGMNMAGSLVGTMVVPEEVVEYARERRYAAAG